MCGDEVDRRGWATAVVGVQVGRAGDTVRDFWRGEPATLGEFASRITGSSDLYANNGRRATASINFITAHVGFTLRDLVSYNVFSENAIADAVLSRLANNGSKLTLIGEDIVPVFRLVLADDDG